MNNFNEVKAVFNNECIHKICGDLESDSEFVEANKLRILDTLLIAIRNSVDLSIPVFKKQREAYLFVAEQIEREISH